MTPSNGAVAPTAEDVYQRRKKLERYVYANFTKNKALVEDLVMEAVTKAIKALGSFKPGTNLDGWLTTICRNTYLSHYRKRKREVEDTEGKKAKTLVVEETQEWQVVGRDILAALAKLSATQRQVVTLVLVDGKSYTEVAAIQGVSIGTIKSRLNRTKAELKLLLNDEPPPLPRPPRPPGTRAKLTMLSWRWQNGQRRKERERLPQAAE